MFPRVPHRQAKSSPDSIMLQIKKRSNNKARSKIDGYQTANICRFHLQTCKKVIPHEAFARIKMFKASPENNSMELIARYTFVFVPISWIYSFQIIKEVHRTPSHRVICAPSTLILTKFLNLTRIST